MAGDFQMRNLLLLIFLFCHIYVYVYLSFMGAFHVSIVTGMLFANKFELSL